MTKRIGSQIPTQSIVLPYETSDFELAVELYEKTGRTAQGWQAFLLEHIMGRNEDDLWVHTKFGFSLPRRNGKNEIAAIRELWGLLQGERILHTAHRTTTSHTAWERLLLLLDKAKIEYTSLRASGRERIDLKDTEGRIEFRTRSTKGGLGEGFDLLVVDEAQEYTPDQESALKYVVTDSKNPQTIFCGTPPTPLSSGTIFMDLRKSALEGAAQNTGWAEWSVEDESDPHDVDLWYLTNPSLGTIFTERSVADEVGQDVIDFNIQRLGLWLKYNQKSAISEIEWSALKVETMPDLTGKLFVGIRYGNDGVNVAMAVAVKTTDDRIFTEVIDCRSVRKGNGWILDFLRNADVQQVVIDGASGQSLLAGEMKDIRLRDPVLPTVREIILANSAFEQAVFKKSICHAGQPSLHQVVTNCEKRAIGSSGGFGYKAQFDDYDIALMDSVMLAHWACANARPPVKQKIRY